MGIIEEFAKAMIAIAKRYCCPIGWLSMFDRKY
jgi:hypothetical protein